MPSTRCPCPPFVLRPVVAAALLAAIFTAFGAPSRAQPLPREVGGEWGPVLAWPHVPVSMANLPDGRVLTFSSNERDAFPSGPEFTYAATWDPDTGQIVEIPHPSHDMFCASLVMLEDGRVFVSGGRNQADSPWTSLFDFQTSSWIPIEDMNRGRWYPTSVAMPGGEVVIFGGIGGEQHPEIWRPGSGWQLLTGIDLTQPMLQYGLDDGAGLWPLLQLDPRGKVFHAGATPTMHAFEPLDGLGSYTVLGPHDASWFPDEGVSVLYDEGRLLVAGGTETSTLSSDQAMIIDITGPAPQVSPAAPMQRRRQFLNEIMLPTGQVLVVGGSSDGRKFNDVNAVLEPEVWDPITGAWTLLNPQSVPRTYHSTAVLLVDGRVLSAGGGLDGGNPSVNHWDGEVFSPPYLFTPGGAPAVRPVITAAPGVTRVGASFPVEATPGLAGFSMVKMSATTHTMNTDLRFLRPASVETAPGSYALTLQANANVLTPGYWMLFALDGAGVPSVAAVIQVVTSGEPRGTPIPDQYGHLFDPVLLQVEAVDPDGSPLTYSATGLPAGLTLDPGTGLIQGVLTGTGVHQVSITVDDGSESAVVSFQWVVSLASSEFGTVQVSQSGAGQWHTVDLQNVYGDPIVVMGPPSFGDSPPVTVRVDDVTPTSFRFQLDEWDYQNGSHGIETVSYVVVEAGAYALPGGGSLVAGRSDGTTTGWRTQLLPDDAFEDGAPAVLAQVASANGNEAVTVRLRGVDETQFEVRLQEQESGNDSVAPDDVHWIAVDAGANPGLLEADVTGVVVTSDWHALSYAQPFSGPPHLLASMQTFEGGNSSALRHRNASASGVEVVVEEEQSGDTEVGHIEEAVGWLAIDPSAGDLGLLPLFNTAPTVASPGDQGGVLGDAVSLPLLANDPDGDPLSFSATGLPGGLSIDPLTGEIAGTLNAPGVHDVVVTVTDTGSATGTAAFQWTVGEPIQLEFFPTPPQPDGASVDYTAVVDTPGSYAYTWDFGDGSPQEGPSADVSHVFPGPGRYVVTLTVTDPASGASDSIQFVQMVHAALGASRPTGSSSVAYEAAAGRLWVANPDNDTVTVVDAAANAVVQEIPVSASPRTLAIAGDGRVWVTAKEAAAIDVLHPGSLSVATTLPLPRGSQPHGIAFDPAGGNAFVALEGTGEVLRLDGATGALLASEGVGGRPRHLGVSADGATVYVSRFVTPPLPGEHTDTPLTEFLGTRYGAEVLTLAADTLAPGEPLVLHHSDATPTEHSGPGLPNYLGVPAISPDGSQLWVPSKQDDVLRGAARDGVFLTFDSTVRAIVSRIDLATGLEDEVGRIDHDDASMVSTALFGPVGAYLFTALEGNREIAVIDALSKGELGRFPAGRAPQGLALSPDGRTLYVHNFMDRTLTVHSLDALYDYNDVIAPPLATVPLVASEALAPDVLAGKQFFYDAKDPRLALQGYMACASCHNDGGQDGRIWDFTQFGEGLRNTIGLRGRGHGHGPVHWTANFDEVQDFEGQIRSFAGGSGLMSDADFHAGTTSDPLGDPKAGLSADLDALAAYVGSLVDDDASPHRESDGSLTPEGEAGRAVFANGGCGSCHAGVAFTDSAQGVLHDVGTLKSASGPQTALDTPTLRGVWQTGPYLHDGSAATIPDAVDAHTGVALAAAELASLAAYLEQIDGSEAVAPNPNTPPNVTSPGSQTHEVGETVSLGIVASDDQGDALSFGATGLPPGLSIDPATGEISGTLGGNAALYDVTVSVDDGLAVTEVGFAWTVSTPGNAPPQVVDPGAQTSTVGELVALPIAASDSDGDPLAFGASGLPAGLAIDPVSGEIGGIVAPGAAGMHAVTVTVDDGTDAVQIAFDWTVFTGNQPPQITSPGDQASAEGDDVLLLISASDADGDALDFAAGGLPPALSIDAATGEISGTIASGSAGTYDVTVTVDDGLDGAQVDFTWTVDPPAAPVVPAEVGIATATNGEWTPVPLTRSYTSMVVVTTPLYTEAAPPQVVRVRNAAGSSFEVLVDRFDGGTDPVSTTFHYLVVEEGVYDAATYGVRLEAAKHLSTVTEPSQGWVGENVGYAQAYTSPVVVGQVMTANDPRPSVFWTRGADVASPPDAASLWIGKTVNADPDSDRADETLGYVVIEAGPFTLADRAGVAGVGDDIVRGMDNGPPFVYPLSGLASAQVALASQGAMEGADGGWAVLYGAPDPSGLALNLVIDEDQLRDSERKHAREPVGYLVFEEIVGNQPPQLADPGDQVSLEGDPVSLLPSALDPDGDTLAFTATGLPPGLGIDPVTGEIAGTVAVGSLGSHDVTLEVTDGELVAGVSFVWNVTEPLDGIQAEAGFLPGVTNTEWTRVDLAGSYFSMVAVATPSYAQGAPPQVVRLRNAAGSSFEIRMARRDGLTDPVATDVHFLVVEEGVYDEANHGVKLEAVRRVSTVTDHARSWVGETVSYAHSYTTPVVVGSVMTSNDVEPSVFWAAGSSSDLPPSADSLRIGKTVTSDPNTLRVDETLGYVVVEAGSGTLAGLPFTAGVGPIIVRGFDNGPPYVYPLSGVTQASAAVASLAGMVGADGAWAVLYGPLDPGGMQLDLVADEDQLDDAERKHKWEAVSYLVFE